MNAQTLQRLLLPRREAWAGRFARVTPGAARGVLGFVVLLTMYGFWISVGETSPGARKPKAQASDLRLYQHIVERVHAGQSYYTVAGEALRARGYAVQPAFNWRLPTLACFLGMLPDPAWGRSILLVLLFVTWAAWSAALRQEAYPIAWLGGSILMLLSLSGFLGENAFYFHECWAAVLIALCLAARGTGAVAVSLAAGLLALSIRELALVPIGVLLLLALWERRWWEAGGWMLVILIFFAGLLMHHAVVDGLIRPEDPMNRWLSLGGWDFVLKTAVWSGVFTLLPPWAIALVLPACLTGLFHWRSPLGTRVALCTGAYVLAFLAVGRSDNFYWGVLYAPVLTLGLLYAPDAFLGLWRNAFRTATSQAPISEPQ